MHLLAAFLTIPLMQPPLVSAHRGGMGNVSSNTLEQFENAIRSKTDIIEMDLRLTKDGVVVVYHDEKLDEGKNCDRAIKDYTWAEIQKCPLARSGHKIPSFEQVLARVQGRAIVDAEFKDPAVIAPAILLVQKYFAHDWTYFQTGNSRQEYAAARAADARVALQFKATTDEDMVWAASVNDQNLIIIEMDKDFVSASRIARVHDLGKFVKVNSWRYDLVQELFSAKCRHVWNMGVDIAMTNNTASCVSQKKALR